MNKKLHQYTADDYYYINYLKVFQKKLNIEDITTPPKINLPPDINVIYNYDSCNLYYIACEGNEINILLHSDTNTNGCTQWFNFQVQYKGTLRFKILNNRRNKQLFTKCNIYTSKNSCFDIHYYRTNINHPFYASSDPWIATYQKQVKFYTLEFKYTFHDTQFITFSYSEPYPLMRALQLQDYKIIGYSSMKNPIIRIKKGTAKKYVVVLARQHPCETSGSFVAEELIKIIDSKEYTYLIYPMVNPDGVYLGNSRCNRNGFDLNRCWLNASEPEIQCIKLSLQKYESKIAFMIDLHGHSSKQNYFVYGCSNNVDFSKPRHFISRLQNSKYFSLKDCAYRTSVQRQSTARQTFWKQYNVQHSMTVEISLFGSTSGRFIQEDYQKIAAQIYDAIENYNELKELENEPFEVSLQLGESDSEGENDLVIEEPPKMERKLATKPAISQAQSLQQPQLPRVKISHMQRSDRRPSFIDIGQSWLYKLDKDDSTCLAKYFPKRNSQPKRMTHIRHHLTKNSSINIEELKNYLIF